MRYFPLILLSTAAASLGAQSVPTTINYQGRLTDNTPSQTPLNATVQMQFAIFDASSGGTRLWQEPAADNTGASVTVTGGIFNYLLGNAVAIPTSVFTGATATRYLQVTLSPAASAEILSPRQLITATGYANLAQSANSAVSATTAITAANSAQLGGVAASGYLTTGGTAFDSSRLGGSLAASYQKRTAAGAFTCSGAQVLQSAAADGAPTCVNPSVTETDPKVGALTTGRVPFWNATSLANGTMFDTGSKVGINTAAPIAPLHLAGANPVSLGAGATTGNSPRAVYIQGQYAYVVNVSTPTLQVFNISNPASIGAALGAAALPSGAQSVFVQGRYAYVVCGGNSLQVFDISNPAAIGPAVGSATTANGPQSVYVQGRYAYVVNSISSTLQVFDISKPAAIGAAVGSAATGTNPFAVFVQGRYAYVVNSISSTLQIFDISNPAAIGAAVGSVATGNSPNSVYVQGRFAYVVNTSSNSLQVFDISNPAAIPAATGSAGTGPNPLSVYIQGRYAYVTIAANSLQVFDISNPAFIGPNVGIALTGSTPYMVSVQGRFAFVVNGNSNTLQAFDLGGAYIQQFESGGIETGTLTAESNAQFNGDVQIKGGLNIGNGGINSDGSIVAANFTGTLAGNAATATKLSANGSNCPAGQFPLGVDAFGAAEGCTPAATGTVTGVTASAPLASSGGAAPAISLTGIVPVANGGTGSATKNFVDLTTDQGVFGYKSFLGGVTVGGALDWTGAGIALGDISGNAGSATALFTNGANCLPGQFPLGVDASGNAEGCTADKDTTYTAGPGLTLTGTQFTLSSAVTPVGAKTDTAFDAGAPDVGRYSSMTVGSDGLGIVSYYDLTNHDLKVLHCDDPHCTVGTITRLDSAGDVGSYSSITAGSDGLALISYYDATNNDLKVAHCSNLTCTLASFVRLITAQVDGSHTSITLDNNGNGIISYYNATDSALMLASCVNIACTNLTSSIIDNTSSAGMYSSIATNFGANRDISYFDQSTNSIKFVSGGSPPVTIAALGAGGINGATSLTHNLDGTVLISFTAVGTGARVAYCDNFSCTGTINVISIDSGAGCSGTTSITIGNDGMALITSFNNTPKVTRCNTMDCSSHSTANIESTTNRGDYNSISIGTDGLPLISYYDGTNTNLIVQHCASPGCRGYTRRH